MIKTTTMDNLIDIKKLIDFSKSEANISDIRPVYVILREEMWYGKVEETRGYASIFFANNVNPRIFWIGHDFESVAEVVDYGITWFAYKEKPSE